MNTLTYGYSMLVVSDMQQSVDFYSNLLDSKPTFSSPRWSQFNLGDVLIGLHAEDNWSNPNDPLRKFGVGQKGESFGLYVEDIEATVNELKDKNIPIIDGPRITGLGNTIYIQDPDDYYIQICQPHTTNN